MCWESDVYTAIRIEEENGGGKKEVQKPHHEKHAPH